MGIPNKPCSECPFLIENRGTMCAILIDQMEDNARALKGFPCHKNSPKGCILTCASEADNANNCVGYKLMMENRKKVETPHPHVVSSFDELARY